MNRVRKLAAMAFIAVGPTNPMAVGVVVFGQIYGGESCQDESPDGDEPNCGEFDPDCEGQ